MLDKLLDKTIFAQMVEQLVHTEKMSYMGAALHICDDRLIDPGDIAKLIAPAIRSKIEAEAMSRNLLPKSNTLSDFI